MSIDSRLREGLDRSMSGIETDVDRHLPVALRDGRRRAIGHRLVLVPAVAAVVAVAAFAAPAVLDVLRGQQPRPATPAPVLPITGSYTTQITVQDAVDAGAEGAQGSWLLSLSGDGQFDLSSLTNGDIGRSVTQYSLTGSEILTTALDTMCTGVGRYTWSRDPTTVTFAPVSDPCLLRVAVLSSHPWQVT